VAKIENCFIKIKGGLHTDQPLDAMKGCKAWAKRAHALYENNTTTLHDERELNNSEASSKEVKGQEWKLGLDVDLRHIVAAIECEAELDWAATEVFPSPIAGLGERKDCGGPHGPASSSSSVPPCGSIELLLAS
jgi:hypothetical protein